MPTSSRSRRQEGPGGSRLQEPLGDNSHGGQGGGGQHLHDRLPIPAKAPRGDSITGVAENKPPPHEKRGFKGGQKSNTVSGWAASTQSKIQPINKSPPGREIRCVATTCRSICPLAKEEGLPLSLLGEEWHCSQGTGGGQGHLHCQDRHLGQTFCL